MTRWFRVRRHLDRVVAAALAIVTAPLVLAMGWLVRREDGGPALIRVERMGAGGKPFGMVKVRTMRVAGPDGLASGPALTAAQDPRITNVGARLRALHIDEVPQLYNVVAGQMTLIGPRPESPDFVDLDDPGWSEVLAAPPGILGPTQIVVGDWETELISDESDPGRYRDEVLPVKLALDRWYLQAATPGLDLLTLVSLVAHLFPWMQPRRLRDRVGQEVPSSRAACAFSPADRPTR